VLAAAALFAVVAAVFGLQAPGLLGRGSNDFDAAGSESSRAERAVERASGLSASAQVLVLVREPTAAKLRAATAAIEAEPAFPLVQPPLRSRDGSEALLAAYADAHLPAETWRNAATRVERRLAQRPDLVVGGPALATRQVNSRVQHDLTRAEAIAFPILFVLALFVFRGVVAALLPLLCGALTILGALLLLRILDAITPVSSYALNIVTGAGLGLGIDYSLLLVSRYREELRRLGPGPEAVRETLRTAGRTVAFSAVTVAAAIATLAVFPLGFLRSMGIAGGFVAPLAGLDSLTVLPALFRLLGERVTALAVRHARVSGEGGWYRLAHGIMRRPLPVALASAAVLVVLGIPFAGIRFTGVDATVLPPGAASRVVDEAVRNDFPPRALSTAFAVGHGDSAAYAARVRALPEAAAVFPPRRLGPGTWELRVSSGRGFLDDRSQRLVARMRALPGGALVGGSAAQVRDQKHAIGGSLPLAIALICAITFVLLAAATRSLVLPLKALVMNFLTLSAAFGILVFVFQDGRLEGLLGYRSQGALELTQPVLLFAIAFGLSTDYGVFLLTRIREAWDAGLPNREAVAVGLERTGRIVTAAALLFCIAVGSFATSQIVFVKEVGLGIALAVLIDASIVRALLVPSLMALLGRWNWWPWTRA
jgi:RND superfamily putative drug exporter